MATFGLALEEKALIVIMTNHLTNSQPKMVYTKKINSIIQNKKGNIIIGTTNGICQYDGQKFTRYPVSETLNITCLLEDKNENLWFGTMGNGVYRFNGSKLDNFQHTKDQIFNRGT
jgi:ligand-binding sensor domain-containing protein